MERVCADARFVCLIGVAVLASFGVVDGATYDATAEYSAGSGSNQATIVIDFDLNNYFMFTYEWDGDATGWDALDAIDLAGSLVVDATWSDAWQSHFVNDFDYPGGVEYDYGAEVAGWGYYGSMDNENWSSNTGVDGRSLSDGDWDSWVWTNYDASWAPLRAPGGAPVPEPATLALLGLGGMLLGRKRRA